MESKEKAVKASGGTSAESTRGRGKVREGLVVSDKMAKTIVVEVTRLEQHPAYKKYVHKTKRYYVHDEAEAADVGDLVRIVETRPLSKLKRWKLASIVRKSDPTLARVEETAVGGM